MNRPGSSVKVAYAIAVSALFLVPCASPFARAQDVRARTRLKQPDGTTVTRSQAVDLTLTVTPVSVRTVQTWVRTAGPIDRTRRIVTAHVPPPDSALIEVGQRVRAFPVESRSSVNQARVTRVVPRDDGVLVETTLSAQGRDDHSQYLLEIIADRGELLSIPSEAIIDDGVTRTVYVQRGSDDYSPRPIRTGVQGELYTQVLDGVSDGDQVVTFGSFFIDAEYKLKIAGLGAVR